MLQPVWGDIRERDRSVLGRIHNKFAKLRGDFWGRDGKGVIAEVERGEDVIKARFEDATRDNDLPNTLRQRVAEEYAEIKADQDTISALKHRLN